MHDGTTSRLTHKTPGPSGVPGVSEHTPLAAAGAMYKIYGSNEAYSGRMVQIGEHMYTTQGGALEWDSYRLVSDAPEVDTPPNLDMTGPGLGVAPPAEEAFFPPGAIGVGQGKINPYPGENIAFNPVINGHNTAATGHFVYLLPNQFGNSVPYVGAYHEHQDGTLHVGVAANGSQHEIPNTEIIVPSTDGDTPGEGTGTGGGSGGSGGSGYIDPAKGPGMGESNPIGGKQGPGTFGPTGGY